MIVCRVRQNNKSIFFTYSYLETEADLENLEILTFFTMFGHSEIIQ
jgi:hypothetical protein